MWAIDRSTVASCPGVRVLLQKAAGRRTTKQGVRPRESSDLWQADRVSHISYPWVDLSLIGSVINCRIHLWLEYNEHGFGVRETWPWYLR